MDDDLLEPKDLDEEIDGDLDDDVLAPGKKKPKKSLDEDESLDDAADEEDAILPEDGFDDQDLW